MNINWKLISHELGIKLFYVCVKCNFLFQCFWRTIWWFLVGKQIDYLAYIKYRILINYNMLLWRLSDYIIRKFQMYLIIILLVYNIGRYLHHFRLAYLRGSQIRNELINNMSFYNCLTTHCAHYAYIMNWC